MRDDPLEALERRLGDLEGENRSLRRILLGALVLSLAIGVMGQAAKEAVPQVIRARRFEVLDQGNEVVGTVAAKDGWYPFIELKKAGGQGSGGALCLEVPPSSGPSLRLVDALGKARAHVYLGPHVSKLADNSGRFVDKQVPRIVLMDENEKARGEFGNEVTGDSMSLTIRDSSLKVVFQAPQ